MKIGTCAAIVGLSATGVLAQDKSSAADVSFLNLTTPTLMARNQVFGSVSLSQFGKPDDLTYGSVDVSTGVARDWEADLGVSLARDGHYSFGNGGLIRYGGTAFDLLAKYRVPCSFDLTAEGGLAYTNTPAQPHRIATVLEASAGYAPIPGARFYVNPRAVFIKSNTLVGLGLGEVVDFTPEVSLFGSWTPMLTGKNQINPTTGLRESTQLFGIGLRFSKVIQGGSLDVAYTNSTGQDSGFGLTPSLGNTGGVYVGLSKKF